jgi:hypothetical protein
LPEYDEVILLKNEEQEDVKFSYSVTFYDIKYLPDPGVLDKNEY